MSEQLITINPDGSLSGLDFKAKGAVSFRDLGPATTKRITDIEWEEERQCWNIRFLLGTLAGSLLTVDLAQETHMPPSAYGAPHPETGVLGWDDYDTAVSAEVAMIQAARLTGKGSLVGEA